MFFLPSVVHSLALPVLGSLPLADVNSAFKSLGEMIAGYLPGILGFVFVIIGYQFLTSLGDTQSAVQAKRSLSSGVMGSILIATGIALAATIATTLTK